MSTITLSVKDIQAAFTEWDRQWRENPEEFQDMAVHLLKGNEETYGEEATPFFLELIKQVQSK